MQTCVDQRAEARIDHSLNLTGRLGIDLFFQCPILNVTTPCGATVATGELPLHCDAIVTEFPQGLAPFTFPKVHADRFGGKRAQ